MEVSFKKFKCHWLINASAVLGVSCP